MSAIDNVPLWQLLQFAKSYAGLGFSIQEQIGDLVQYGNGAEVNVNAVEEALQRLRPMPAELKSICEAYLEGEAEVSASGGRHASSDAALRGRLVRLAHSRPDLRADILPLLTDKAACGWDGGESDTMGCGEGTVMAKHKTDVSVDPTKDMSPEDAKEWEKQKVINKDKFTKGASALRR